MMADKEKLTMMFKDDEVFSFEVDYKNQRVHFLQALEHFDKAPYGVKNNEDKEIALIKFFNGRSISPCRIDYEKIIKTIGVENGYELAFKGHGLSLSNHYWFKRDGESLKYDEINFFKNGWDDTFGKAVLSGDYEALKTCDLNVPDIVTSGWGVKAWLNEGKPKLYKLGIDEEHPEEAICEVLASKIGQRLFKNGEVSKYEFKEKYGRFASVSETIVGENEELVPMSSILPLDLIQLYHNRGVNKEFSKEFINELARSHRKDLYDFFVKVACFRSLCFISDLHMDNLCAIRNVETEEIRAAPILDLGGAFGSTKSGRNLIANANKGTFLIIYFMFADLDPSWDYSWYDPHSLDGAEEEIREYLSKSAFYTPDIILCALDIYRHQKQSLDEMKHSK